MGHPDFVAAATRQHDSQVEADAVRGERLADLKEELKHDMQRALQGMQSFVMSTVTRLSDMKPAERLSSAAEETMLALDNMEACEALMHALKFSECPHMAKLRNAVVSAYVKNTAEALFEAREMSRVTKLHRVK